MMRSSSSNSLLVFASVPPPEHGQSRMVATMLEALEEGREVIHVDARFSFEMAELGSGLVGKMIRALGYMRQALLATWRGEAKILYYVPGPVTWSAVIRDWVMLGVMRPWFRSLIWHWHAVGQGEWAHGGNRCRLPGPTCLDWLARRVSAWILRRPALSIAVSPTSAGDAYAVESDRVEVVCNGIVDPCPDFNERIAPRRRARAEEIRDADLPEVRILFMAYGTVEKGLFDMLSALEAVLLRLGDGVRVSVTIAGGVAENCEEQFVGILKKLEAEFGTSVEICRRGFVDGREKEACFEDADLFIASSRWESFGLTVLESMAWGVPIVAAASDGVKGVLTAEYEWMAPPADPECLAEKLQTGAKSVLRGEGADRGERLREKFLEGFENASFVEGIRSVLEEHCDGESA